MWTVLGFLGAFPKLPKATFSFAVSVHPSVVLFAWNNWSPIRRISIKFLIRVFFPKICRENSSFIKFDKCTGILHEHFCTFMTTSRWILHRMRNVSDKSCREIQNTHFMFNNFFSENCAVYEIMWKNILQPDTAHALCMLDDSSYRHTLVIFNIYWFLWRKNGYANAPKYQKYIASLVTTSYEKRLSGSVFKHLPVSHAS